MPEQDSFPQAAYEWAHEGMWKTSILHGLLTFFALLFTPWVLFYGAALGWLGAWVYKTITDLASAWVNDELTRRKILGETLDVAVPIIAILLATAYRGLM